MPDLRHKPIDAVRSLLESHGLKIGGEAYKPHPKINQGLIINHQPTAGELIPVGQVVHLEISGSQRRTEDKGCYLDIKHQVSSMGAPYKWVRIIMEDEREKPIEVVNEFYQSGMNIENPPLRVVGQATMRIYEDRVLIQTKEFDW